MNLADEVFKKVYYDEEIRNIYNKIDEKEEQNENAWCHHNFNHVDNVKNLVIEILSKLKCSKELIDEAKIAAILHDVGALEGKQNHAYRSYQFAKNYFAQNNIELKDNNLILEAIKNHSDGFDTDNIIQLALILADKLDIKCTRTTQNGLKIPGNREFNNITDIKIDLVKNNLEVFFYSNKYLNREELENYYFMDKVKNAIKSFSEKFELQYRVYLNDEEWNKLNP